MTVTAPTIDIRVHKPHRGQAQVLREAKRFNLLACGRRWGKTEMGVEDLALPYALQGKRVGWFAPSYKLLIDAWNHTLSTLKPLGKMVHVSKTERRITVPGSGHIEYWSTEPAQAGDDDSDVARGRKYHRIIYDEAARARRLESDWTKAIRATLADYRGDAWFLSTPKGMGYFKSLWNKGQEGTGEWMSWQMPTSTNPHIHADEIEAARLDLPADAYEQEFLALFLANAACPFSIECIRKCIQDEPQHGEVVAIGCDLAKSTDWTVVIGLDASGNVVMFQRWQSDWRNTRHRVAGMIGETNAMIDSTGVGDPIVEDIQTKCPLAEGFKFSSSSKQQLMEGLAWAIQNRRISFPAGIIPNELETFEYEYRPSGVRYTAPEGMHDDCVDALALAWRALSSGPQAAALDVRGDDMTEDERWFNRIEDESIWS